MRCEQCGADLPEDALFCGECGVRVPWEHGQVDAWEATPQSGAEGEDEGLVEDRDAERTYIGVGPDAAEAIPALHYELPGATVMPPSAPMVPVLERGVIIGIAVIAAAVAVVLVALLGWVVIPSMLIAAAGA